MGKWDDDGGGIATTLFEAAVFQRTIKLTCYCGHAAILNPYAPLLGRTARHNQATGA